MFLKKLFQKSFKHYLDMGDKYFGEDRFADARHAYLEALEKLESAEDRDAAERQVREKLAETGNKLALLNISEADFYITRGEGEKAREYLALARELAADPTLSRKADDLERTIGARAVEAPRPKSGHSCGGCGTHAAPADPDHEDQLFADDRFGFLINTLPEELASRYAAMGEKFAEAYLAAQEGNDRHALSLYEQLLKKEENDVLLYEAAIIHFRHGGFAECERLLRRALSLNPANELCCVSFVQLLVETGRPAESIAPLQKMIAEGMMGGQAPVMLADVFLMLGEEAKAMDLLAPLLQEKSTAKAAAERLVPILERQNRGAEAAFLFKTHLKGCC